MGRPPIFESPGDLEKAIKEYFEPTGVDLIFIAPKTISGLAYHLGFESRQSLYDYEKREEFSYIIKRARLRIEMGYEENLSGKQPAGSIFALKNMGWSDRQEIDHTTQGEKIQSVNYTGISDAALREIAGLDKSKSGTD